MAYAAIASLGQTLDQILHPDRHLIPHHKEKLESLREKLSFLQDFLENFQGADALEILEERIRETAYAVEDIIEYHVYMLKSVSPFTFAGFVINSYAKVVSALQIMMPSSSIFECGMDHRDKMLKFPYLRLESAINSIDSIVEDANEVIEWYSNEVVQTIDSLPASPSKRDVNDKSSPVGLDDDLLIIMDRLTGSGSKLEVVPIVGMGGIGKTTLAGNVYTDQLIKYHFDARAWITISQEYDVRDVLLRVLDSLGKLNDKMIRQEEGGLAEHLHKTLCRRRYLIVMDDIWSTDAWDDFKRNFPENNNGSRIILTTRLERVAIYAASGSSVHYMNLLHDHESWKLLSAKVFGEERCPRQLVKVGEEIARGCSGLPLAVVVMAGLLSKVNRTPDEWKNVAEKMHSVANEDNDACFQILRLSYNHLPQHLKACFLYMGVFPEDKKVSVSKVVRLWIAEGFLKQNRTKTLEDVAEEYILELAERNLISILSKRRQKYYGRNKIIGVHDLLRDLCIREARKEKFLHVMKRKDDYVPKGIVRQRCLSLYPNIPDADPFFKCIDLHRKLPVFGSFPESLKDFLNSASSFFHTRSLLYTGRHHIPLLIFSGFALLRVLDITQVLFFEFPMQIIELCNLRYLAFSYHGEVPESISKLWNLQTLIFSPLLKTFAPCPRSLPLAIWSMLRLRHLKFPVWYLSDFPSLLPGWKTCAFLENLQTLSEVSASFCTKEVLQEIPNLKKLGIWMETWDQAPFYINNLACLQQLVVLKCSVRSFPTRGVIPLPSNGFPPKLAFPIGLKELTLRGCGIPWKDMTIVGSLPHLERLKLQDYAFIGPEWKPTEEEFSRLNFLHIDGSDLVYWGADSILFPVLRHLIVENCHRLEAIPSCIGEIATLQSIELDTSSALAVTSAKEILEEQQSAGNDSLHVHIYPTGTTFS